MKTMNWTGANGNEVELRAECKITLREKILDADGDQIATGEMRVSEDATLELYVDEKRVQVSYNTSFWKIIDVTGTQYKRVWGLNKMAMTADKAKEVEAFLNEVIKEGKTEEVAVHEAAKVEAEKAEEIKSAKEIIKAAEEQKEIPTAKEYKAWRTQYNNLHNEGGEGFIPTRVTKEQYDAAKAFLNQ